MNPPKQGPHAEGLKLARFIMVLSSISPHVRSLEYSGHKLDPCLVFHYWLPGDGYTTDSISAVSRVRWRKGRTTYVYL